MVKIIRDVELERIFNAPPVTEAPPIAELVRCKTLNCVYNDGRGLCTEEHEVLPLMVNGQCEFAELDDRLCGECGCELEEVRERGYGADADGNRGVDVTWLVCPNH